MRTGSTDDLSGYIQNLGRPRAAVVASQARIAQAHADREGLSEALAQALSSGVAGLQMARSLLSHTNGNGPVKPEAPAVGRSEEPPSQSS